MAGQPLAEAYVRIGLDTREFERGLAGSKAAFAATANSIQNSARQLSAGVMAAFAGIAAAAASLKKVTQSATEFDRSMREVWTLMDVSEKEMRELASRVEELGVRYGQTGAKSLKAFYQIVSASFSGAEGMKVLDVAMKSAVAGITDVYTSADALTSILNAYRMSADEAEHVSDVMFQTVKRGKTTMSELSATIGRLTGIAAPAGVSIEELGAAIAALTRGGLATDEAVTALRAAIVELQKPSEALQAIIQDLGYETGTAAIKAEGFFPLLRKIAEKAEEAGIPLTDLFGNIRSLTAVLPLAGDQAEAVAKDLEAMRNAAGSTDKAFQKMAEGVSFQTQQLSAAFDQLSTKIGSLVIPVFLDLMNNVLNPFIDTLRWAAEGLQSVINVSVEVTGLEDAEASFAEFTAGLERMLTTGLLAWAMKAFGGKVSPLAGRIGFSIPLIIQFLTEIRYAIEKPEFGPLISELYRALEEAFPGALIGGLLFGLPGAVAGAAVSILIPTIIRFETDVQAALEEQRAELGKTLEQVLTLEVEIEPKLPEVEALPFTLVELGITDMLNQVRTAITEWTQGRLSLQKAASEAASIVSRAMANMGLEFRDLVPWLYQEFKEVPAAFWEAWLSEMGTSVAEFTTLLAQQAKKVTPKVEVEAPPITLPGFAAPEAPQAPITLPGFAPAEVPSLIDIIRQYQAAQSQATSAAEGAAQSSEQASNAAQKAASAVEVWARQVKAGTLSVADFLDKVRQAAQAQGVTAEKLIEYYAVVAELYNWFQDLGEAQAAFFGSSEKAKAAADLLADFLGIEVEKRRQATDAFTKELEKITQPSAEAARKLLELARNATPEQLVQLNQKFRALLQTGKELYEAQSIYGGATAQVTENLRAFLQVLGFGPARVEDILASLGVLEQAGPSLAEQLEKLRVPTGATGAALASLARQAGGDSLALKEIYDKAQSLIQLAPQLIKAYEFFGLSTEKVTENLKQFLSNLGLAPEKINDILVSLGLLKTPLEEFKDRLAALREPSAETGRKLASLIPEASQFQGGLVELYGKTQALISAAKEEYEARKFFGLATEQLTEQLRAFLSELGLAPDQIDDIITKIVGAGEDLTRTLNALVSQAEALTLAQADQVLALREQALAVLRSGQVTDKEGNVREATIGELLAAASAVQSFSTWLDSAVTTLERLITSGETELQPLYERFKQLKESMALGPTFEEQRRALLESIKLPSESAGRELRRLALEGAGSAEVLVKVHAKAQDLISVAKELYEAQRFFGLSTEETISNLRSFLLALNLSEQDVDDIVSEVTGIAKDLSSVFSSLVSQAEAFTLAQADQVLALREQALAVLKSGKVTDEEGNVREATISELLAATSAIRSFSSWLDAAITTIEQLITSGEENLRPLYEQFVRLRDSMALGPTFADRLKATLETLTVPSAEAGEKLRQLALESGLSAEDLIAIHSKAENLISVAKQLYEAQSFLGLSVEETISGLTAFLTALGLGEEQIENIIEGITGAGEDLVSVLNALVSQAEALTLAQADQILALREQALAVLESGRVVTEEGEVRQATIGEILAAASAVSSFASWLDAAITVLERLITAGDEAVRPLYEQLVKLKGKMALGPTFEEQRRAQEEARRAAERAAEEARKRQEELARKVREAWEESFKSPAKKALESGDWLKAALAIREIARRKDDLIAEARALPALQGKTVELAKVYDLIIGGQRELLSNLDKAIKVLQIAGEDATKLEELKARIEELFDPLGEWKRALREAVKAMEEAPRETGLKLRELFLKAKGFQKGGIVTGPTLALLGEAGPEAVIPLAEGGVVGGVPGEVVCTEDYCAAVQTASDALSGFAKTSSSAMDLFAEHINALREVDPEFARRFTKPLASGCMACAKAAEGLTGELTSAAQGSKVIAEILEDKFWNALEDVRGELVPSAEAASLVADKAREQIQAYESLIEDMELFGLDTRDVRRELEEFKAGLRGLSPELARLAEALEDLSSELIDTLVGAAFDLVESLFSLEGAASEAYSALNVPAGFKGARYEWAAAKPGEPYRPVEETGEGITDFLKRVVQTFLGWLEEQVSSFLKDLLAGFSWENFVSQLDWGAFVSFLGWDDFLSWLDWGDWVGGLDWNRFVSILDWHRWINPLEWPSLLGDISGSLVAFINSGIETLLGWLEDMLGPVLGPIVGALGEFLQGLVAVVGSLLMLGTALGLVEGVAAIIVGALQGIGDLINAFLTPISEELGRSWEKLTPLIDATRQLFASLSPVLRALGEVVAIGIRLMTDLFAALAPLFSAIAKVIGALAEALAPAIRIIAKLFETVLTPVVAVLAGGLKALAWVVDLLGDVVEGVINSLKWIFNIFIGALNMFIDAVNFLFGWVGVHLEHLPYLQRGGIVTRPTLAWLGEAGPEAVIPLTGFNYPRLGLAAAGASISIEVEGRLVGDGRELVGVIERVRVRDEIVRGKR